MSDMRSSSDSDVRVIFRALDPANADEGLAIAIDNGQVLVQIAVEGKTRTVWLHSEDALRMALGIAVALRPDGVGAFVDSMRAADPNAVEAH